MTEYLAELKELNYDLSDGSYVLSHDDDVDVVPAGMAGRHRNLMEGEVVPSNITMFQQLAMVWR